MEAVFLKLINMGLTAVWLILAVVLFRIIFSRAPKWTRCLLWAFVAVRLVVPFSFESLWSLVPSEEPIPQKIIYAQNPEIESGIDAVDQIVNPVVTESLKPNPAASVNPIQIWLWLFSRIWIIGMIGIVIYGGISYIRLKRKVQVSLCIDKNIYVCDAIDTPFILGLLYPRIYLPSDMEEKNQEYVLAHERAHIFRKDHLWKPLGFIILTVYWFCPWVWLAYILFCRDMELACDERVIRELDGNGKKAYSEALLELSIPRKLLHVCPLAFGEVGVIERIRHVLQYRKPKFWLVLAAGFGCIFAVLCFFTSPSSEKDIFGATYSVKEMLYDAPQYSFVYKLENAPKYTITADSVLMESGGMGGDSWTELGSLKKVDYTRQERYAFFDSLPNKTHEALDQVTNCWRVDSQNDNEKFWIVMQTRRSEVLLATGYRFDGGERVRWLWKLEKQSGTYDLEEMKSQIERMSGQGVQPFALYEVKGSPQHLLIGYIEGNHLGVATFQYNVDEDAYKLRACRDMGEEDLIRLTILQEQGMDHSISIALSNRSDLAAVSAKVNGELQSQGVTSCPSMTVFEWPEILEEEEQVEIRFYNAASEELESIVGSIEEKEPEFSEELPWRIFDQEIVLPENETWIVKPEYEEIESGMISIRYHDGNAEADMVLLVWDTEKLGVLGVGITDEADDTMTEHWQGHTKSGKYTEVLLEQTALEEGIKRVRASWNYKNYRFVITGEVNDGTDVSPVAKTALHIIRYLE